MFKRASRLLGRILWFALISISVGILSVAAIGGESRAYLGLEGRYFLHPPLFDQQSEHSASIVAYYENYHDFDDDEQRISFTGLARVDSEDSERSHVDVRELYWWKSFGSYEIYAGLRKIFWGVTESVHLVDIINQDDNLENIDGEDKLGQAMIQLVNQRDWGLLELFVLPGFREKQYPGVAGRLRAGVPVFEEANYQSDKEADHVDLAFRWSHYFDIWDVSLSHFSGTSRDPIFVAELSGGEIEGLRAHYQLIEQSGLALQATIDAWLWKLEVISIDEKDYRRNSAVVAGLEYTFFSLGGSNSDLGVIAEYQFDDRFGARQSLAQNDLALGFRWAFNDIDDSQILAIVNQDLDTRNRFYSLELSRRITDNWKLEAEARLFSDIEVGTTEYDLRDDDYIQVEIRRYF